MSSKNKASNSYLNPGLLWSFLLFLFRRLLERFSLLIEVNGNPERVPDLVDLCTTGAHNATYVFLIDLELGGLKVSR